MLYCQCSRRQREGRPSWGGSNAPKARIYGMLGGPACCSAERLERKESTVASTVDDLENETKETDERASEDSVKEFSNCVLLQTYIT